MLILLKLSGLISEIVFMSLIYVSYIKAGKLNLHQNTFSYFGANKKSEHIFNNGLTILCLIRLTFVSTIINVVFPNQILIKESLYGAILAGILASSVSLGKSKFFHIVFAYIMIGFSFIFLLLSGLILIISQFYLGLFNILISLILLISTVYFYFKHKINGYFEIFIFAIIFIWDWVMTLKLFGIV